MRPKMNLRPVIFVILAALGLLAAACSPSAEKMNAEGNDRFAKEAYLEALAAYQSAQIESPELAEPYYNAANALYRQGAYPEALEQMEEALRYAADQTIAENSFFNLGNATFNLQSWEEAVDAYTEALLLNPDDQDAKYNLELALQQMQQQQQEQQEQQQQDQQQDQEQQEQSEEQQDQESDQQEQDQSQSGQDQQEQEQDQDQSEENSEEGQQEDQEQDGHDVCSDKTVKGQLIIAENVVNQTGTVCAQCPTQGLYHPDGAEDKTKASQSKEFTHCQRHKHDEPSHGESKYHHIDPDNGQ